MAVHVLERVHITGTWAGLYCIRESMLEQSIQALCSLKIPTLDKIRPYSTKISISELPA